MLEMTYKINGKVLSYAADQDLFRLQHLTMTKYTVDESETDIRVFERQ
jgi:hypothetical protein